MAKKEETTSLVEQFADFQQFKHIDKATMISVLEESFRNVLAKMFGTDENLDVILNPDKGDVQIFKILKLCPMARFRILIRRFPCRMRVPTRTLTFRLATSIRAR